MLEDIQLYFDKQLQDWAFRDDYPYPNLNTTEFKTEELRA